jgi:hypothetical protein
MAKKKKVCTRDTPKYTSSSDEKYDDDDDDDDDDVDCSSLFKG